MINRVTLFGTAALAAAAFGLLPATGALAANKDLLGFWAAGVIWGKANEIALDKKGELNPNSYGVGNTTERTAFAGQYSGGERFIISEQDPGVNGRASDAVPLYKPQYWDQVELTGYLFHSDPTGEYMESTWKNLPIGMPRLGAPSFILAGRNDSELFFIYANENQWRYIPTDCREVDESLAYDVQFNGVAVGCWKDNVLTIVSKGFTTDTWVTKYGGIHSQDMVVTEKITVNPGGMTLAYQRVVDDPMFLQPFDMGTQTLNRNTNPMAFLREDYPNVNTTILELGGGC